MSNTPAPGWRVQTLHGEVDTDPDDAERHTPAGTWGCIESSNHIDGNGIEHWNVGFPNGAWIVLSEQELRDQRQYAVEPPPALIERERG